MVVLGIDYKQAREEYEKATTIAWEAYKKERATPFDANALATAKKNYNEMMEKKKGGENVDMDKLVELEINYFKLLQKEKEHNFRIGIYSFTHLLIYIALLTLTLSQMIINDNKQRVNHPLIVKILVKGIKMIQLKKNNCFKYFIIKNYLLLIKYSYLSH